MKRTPLRRKTPLHSKRKKERRAEGRVDHKRMRPKASADPTAEQRRYHEDLRKRRRCECCGNTRDLVLHHILASVPGKVGRRDHWYVVLICATCHNIGTVSVHLCGSEAKFLEETGCDLVAISVIRLEEWRRG
jgi:hypothetical protein